MANIFWLGTAVAVKQVSTVQITAFDASTTYKITIGTEVVSVVGNTDEDTTASDLQVALEASTHPYFTNIDWTVATDTVTATAGTAGVPYVATSSVTGGAGTIGSVTETTASSGPNDWSTAANWSGAAVPVSNDDVTLTDNSVSVAWGLAQQAVDLDSLTITKTYTGKIGLDRTVFATTSNAATTDTSAVEYRDTYLDIESTLVDIGEHDGPGNPAGSSRIKLNLGIHESTIVIHDSGNSTSEAGLPSIRLLIDKTTTDVFVKSAPAGLGIAVDAPDETSSIRLMSISDVSASSKITLSNGVTVITFEQTGGSNFLNAAATITLLTIKGGVITSNGDYLITTVTISGGTYNCNHIPSSGAAITTLNINGGIVDTQNNNQARTITTTNLAVGGTLKSDNDDVTFTTLNEPTGKFTLIAS